MGGRGQVGRYKLHRAVDEARSKLGKLSSSCIGAVPDYTVVDGTQRDHRVMW